MTAPNPYVAIAAGGMKVGGSVLGYRGRKKALEAQQAALDAEKRRQAVLQAKADAILADMIGKSGWGNTQRVVDDEKNAIITSSNQVANQAAAGARAATASVAPGVAAGGRIRAATLGAGRMNRNAALVARIKAELRRRVLLQQLGAQHDVDRFGLAGASDRSLRAFGYERDAAAMQGISERQLGELLGGVGDIGMSAAGAGF